jgi:alkylhydroperoxidase/carboxymuconolactone decarboxylase family protein YurZ
MDDKERHERGMAKRRKVLGNAWVDRANAKKNAFNEEFQDFITRTAWGEVWTRPHYDERTRRILVIGTMLALDKWEEFRMHVRAATGNLLRSSGCQQRFQGSCRCDRRSRKEQIDQPSFDPRHFDLKRLQ